mmetsp:Transcript_32148/g.35745  ORF Transcript_32148/g.35745 Transcript_32148/m.35745 type:complete len:80 (+) Transcript_32148:658-897(+)
MVDDVDANNRGAIRTEAIVIPSNLATALAERRKREKLVLNDICRSQFQMKKSCRYKQSTNDSDLVGCSIYEFFFKLQYL